MNVAGDSAGANRRNFSRATIKTERAKDVLRQVGAVWVPPLVVGSLLFFVMTLFYVGSVVNPVGHLSGLPVYLSDQDTGVVVGDQHVNLGTELASSLDRAQAVSSRLTLEEMSLSQAKEAMGRNGAYATIVIPADFTRSLLAAYGIEPADPTAAEAAQGPSVEILTNPRAGSVGVELATGVADPALRAASTQIGRQLSHEAASLSRSPGPTTDAASPLTVTTSTFNPLPPNSAIGLSALYIALLAIMCGFIGAVLVHSSVDAALGYGVTEIGPRWRQRMPAAISRRQTLLAKWAVSAVVTPVLVGIMLVVSTGILGMSAPHLWELWTFAAFAAFVIALGTLALLAAFGAPGQLVAMLIFIYLALASSGGTIPIEALPGSLRFVANFEPLRQILDGVRSILYFGASGDAGLTRGLVMTTIGMFLWLAVGVAVTSWYDARARERLDPTLLSYIQSSIDEYRRLDEEGGGAPLQGAAS